MEGLVKEGKEVLDEDGQGPIIDAALIGAAQRVEHYEMAAYGTVRAMAEALGHRRVANLLQVTLDEEGAADEKLTTIAEDEVLSAALGSGPVQ
jgi:ferritin-like metal-binding protein YciE